MNLREQFTQDAIDAKPEFNAWLEKQPTEKPCNYHPEAKCQLHIEATLEENRERPEAWWQAAYFECPLCRETKIQSSLKGYGCPEVNLHCTFDNWEPRDAAERLNLESAIKFAEEVRKGFLLLLGNIGAGKTHLAVAAMRHFRKNQFTGGDPIFIKQSTLLRELRATYGDSKAKDPIPKCQKARLLVLDEMGVSGGGRDEAPMLHEILDHRYGSKLPTIITSNLDWEQLRAELGERLADRMREAAYRILTFSGPSHRVDCRDQYFKDE